MDNSIYEVPRAVYKDFIRGIKKGSCSIEVNENETVRETRMVSKKTGQCYCGRDTFLKEEKENYYIFADQLDAADTQEIVVRPKYVVENAKDLQKILDYISEKNKEAKNAGTI